MTLDEIFARINKVESGAEMVAAIRTEITALRNEAKANRIAKEDILKTLNIPDGDSAAGQTKAIAELMAKLQEAKKDPADIMQQLTTMQNSIKELTTKYEGAEQKAKDAESKRLASARDAELIKALTEAKVVSPTEISKILSNNVVSKEDGSFAYKNGEKEVSLKDGINGYLKNNAWAVGNPTAPGAGSTPPSGKNTIYSKDQIQHMTASEINANWDSVAASLKVQN